MAATAGITQADRLPPVEDFDYSRSHRPVPAPATYSTAAHPPVAYTDLPSGYAELPARSRASSAASAGEGRRRGSFSKHFRLPSREDRDRGAPPLPDQPRTRIAQAQAQAAAGAQVNHNEAQPQHKLSESEQEPEQRTTRSRGFSFRRTSSDRSGSATAVGSMLRKGSRVRKEEQARLERERQAIAAANALPQQPPHLPSVTHLPTIASFGGEDARPDSVAIFNNQYSHYPPAAPPEPTSPRHAPANFSRPGHANAAMPNSSSAFHSSSSPAYAYRPGNAFAQQAAAHAASSSPSVAGPKSTNNGAYVIDPTQPHPQAPGESITNRGRSSYTAAAAPTNVSSPRRIRRRKDPTPFNVLVVGAKKCGKTSLISFLRHSLALDRSKQSYNAIGEGDGQGHSTKSSFTSHFVEADMDGERVGLTLWDSAGLEKHIIDLQTREMVAFIESKFEETFVEEQKVMRNSGARDTHIHCVFLMLDPVKLDSTVAAARAAQRSVASFTGVGGLNDELDLPLLRALWGKTTVIPLIGKADVLTLSHMSFLKRAVWESLKETKLDPLEALELEGDDDEYEEASEDDDNSDSSDLPNGHRKRDDFDSSSTRSSYSTSSSSNPSSPPLPKSSRTNTTHTRQSSLVATITSNTDPSLPYLPMSIFSPDLYDLPPYTKPSPNSLALGRRYPWGFADPYDPDHCDFDRLKDSIFTEWRTDLRDLARTKWYENWRTSRLNNLPGAAKQRVRGGVTPTASVPQGGKMSPTAGRRAVSNSSSAAGLRAAVPRTVSGGSAAGIGLAVSSPGVGGGQRGAGKADRLIGV